MSNFRAALKLFAADTGRHDLVADFASADYTDNGAGTYINAGMQMLDRRFFRSLGADMLYSVTLPADTASFAVPLVRKINSIWVRPSSSNSSSKYRLLKKTNDELLDLYSLELGEITAALPIYYSHLGGESTFVISDGVVASGDNLYVEAQNDAITSLESLGTTTLGKLAIRLHSDFDFIDSNSNSVITLTEINAYPGYTVSGGEFNTLDTNANGSLTKLELEAYILTQHTPFTVEAGWSPYGTDVADAVLNGDEVEFNVVASGFGSLTYFYFITKMDVDLNDLVDDSLGFPVSLQFDVELNHTFTGDTFLIILDTSFLHPLYEQDGGIGSVSSLPAGQFFSTAQIRNSGSYTISLPGLSAQAFYVLVTQDITLKNFKIVPTTSLIARTTLTLSGDKIVFVPRLSEEMVVEVYGDFYTSPMVSPTDTNRWTEKHPYLLNLAAQYKHEISMSNMTRVRELLECINIELVELNMDQIDEEDPDDGFVEIEG